MPREEILSKELGKRMLLLGNEAVVRGAYEAGVNVGTAYPGTPTSEIGDTFAEISKSSGIYFEYSSNEKVAFETAYGASLAGARAIVSFKHYGFNVASDSIIPSAYVGVKGGLVLAVGDDPNCYSSAQSEQDTRHYSRLANLPTLEPSDPDECRSYTSLAFDLSETYDLPVILRLTTKVSHSRGIVRLERVEEKNNSFGFVKNDSKFNLLPPRVTKKHEHLLEKIREVRDFIEEAGVDKVLYAEERSNLAIITAGISFQYVMEAMELLGVKIPVLKLAFSHPLPKEKIMNFLSNFERVLVVEELDPILEDEIVALAGRASRRLEVNGKNLLPRVGEYSTYKVAKAISSLLNIDGMKELDEHLESIRKLEDLQLPVRTAVLCPGCPHRASFFAVRKAAGKGAVFGGDIGCYILGQLPPLETQDFVFSMGAVEGVTHGIKKVSGEQKVIAFLGDSTFYHAGIPGLINMIQNNSNVLVIVLDNEITAMTGHQPNPSSGVNALGQPTHVGKIEDIVKALGAKNVKVVNAFNQKQMEEAVRMSLSTEGVSVIVARRECWLLHDRNMKRQGKSLPKFTIDQSKCTRCDICIQDFGCPAFEIKEDGSYHITGLCLGCAVCVQVCPEGAIHAEMIAR